MSLILVLQELTKLRAFLNRRFEGVEPVKLICRSSSVTLLSLSICWTLRALCRIHRRESPDVFRYFVTNFVWLARRYIPGVQSRITAESGKIMKEFADEIGGKLATESTCVNI